MDSETKLRRADVPIKVDTVASKYVGMPVGNLYIYLYQRTQVVNDFTILEEEKHGRLTGEEMSWWYRLEREQAARL